MKAGSPRENILEKIENALHRPVSLPFPDASGSRFFNRPETETLVSTFAEEFARLRGTLISCSDKSGLQDSLESLTIQKGWKNVYCKTPAMQQELELYKLSFINTGNMHAADAAIMDCECLVARTGTIVLSAAQPSGRALPVYAPVQIVVAFSRQIVPDLEDAISMMEEKYDGSLPSAVSFVAGPSRTGDIERILVTGVHGPREVYLLLLPG